MDEEVNRYDIIGSSKLELDMKLGFGLMGDGKAIKHLDDELAIHSLSNIITKSHISKYD